MAGNKNSGRPRKPTAALKLHGTFREDRHAERFDDSSMASDIEKPAGMSDLANELWDRLVPGLQAQGIAKDADQCQLRGMCEWWSRYMICTAWLRHRQTREAFDGDADTISTISRIQRMAQGAWVEFSAAAAKFGLSPVDRAKLTATPQSDTDDFDKDIALHG